MIRTYTDRLSRSLGSVNSERLAREFLAEKPLDPYAWLVNKNVTLLGDKSVRVIRDLYYEASYMGRVVAEAEVDQARLAQKAPKPRINWSAWKPGDADAARLLLGDGPAPGLKNLLDNAMVTIKGINNTRLLRLANTLSRSVGEGLSAKSTAKAIRLELGSTRAWADMVARTETRRAVTAASIDTYRDADIRMKEWLTADGGCEICGGFESEGAIPLDEGWGDVDGPPAHPNCLCVVLPVVGSSKSANANMKKAGRNQVDEALAALDEIPDVAEGEIAIPWPTLPKVELDPEVWRESEITSVTIVDLVATQERLRRERVEFYIMNPGAVEEGKRAFANVYRKDDDLLIVDGHHRLAALWLLGAEFSNVWYLEEGQ